MINILDHGTINLLCYPEQKVHQMLDCVEIC